MVKNYTKTVTELKKPVFLYCTVISASLITKTKLHSLNRFVFVLPVFGNCAHNYRTLWNNKNSCSIDIISSLLFKNKSVCSIARPHLSIRNEKTPKSLRQVSTVFLYSQNSGFYSLGEFCGQTALFKLSRSVTAGNTFFRYGIRPFL